MDSNTSTLFVVGSFLVAILAALYARWVWGEAHRTNLLALHTHRMEVFRAFHRLRQSVQAEGIGVTKQMVGEFLGPARESRFYISEAKTSVLLNEYYEICFSFTEQSRKLGRSDLSDVIRKGLQDEQDRLSEKEQEVSSAAEAQVEKELLQGVRRRWFDV